jgi:fructosamine-3-kinase
MVLGEFISMSSLYEAAPDATPKPMGWGTYATNPEIHFFLCSFVEMIDEVPDIQAFTSKVAELHRKGISPTGKYGFSVPTFLGRMAQYTTWTDSWEQFYINYVRTLMAVIEDAGGPDEEFRGLLETLIKKVVPRLLRPLETGGRQIQPRLVHGDLYAGNVSVHDVDFAPILYDATSIYAHNECRPQSTMPV